MSAPRSPIATGDAIPDFTLDDQDRKPWMLSQAIRAGDAVLCFYPFAFTGVCGTEMKCITREMSDWRARGLTVVGVSCDSSFVLKAWAAAEGFTHTLLSDQHRTVCQSLGIYWAEMNTTRRATVIVGASASGDSRAKWVQVREPKDGMSWAQVLSHVS